MRRQDREVLEKDELLDILRSCKICRLGLTVDNRPYVVPLNFGYSWENNEPLTLYFHCARQGLKLRMLACNSLACFEMDCRHELICGTEPCDYSFAYASIIGWGRVQLLDQLTEKRYGLQKLLEQQVSPKSYAFSQAALENVYVLRLQAEELSGKKHGS